MNKNSNEIRKVPTTKSYFPKLRFPEFEGEWREIKLGEVCEIKTGKKDTQNKVDDGKYPFYVRSNTVERINTYSYNGEAILTSGDGVGVGKNFHYVNGKFDFHQRVYALIKFKPDYSGKYIYNVFSEKFYKRVIKLSAKNSVDSVRMDMISKMEIFFPLLLEQRKIASFLSLVDERIATQNKILEDYKLLKKGLMQK
ncbi:restriction endonuclease subunit S, partial [Mesonia hippocampi]